MPPLLRTLEVLVIFLALSGICIFGQRQEFEVDKCLAGEFHKDVPSPEGDKFTECLSWKNESCCTLNVSLEIKHFKSVNLYDFYWDICGPLSPECETFIKDEECFFQCEPQLARFEDPLHPDSGDVRNIPICADYCDAWFEACKNDYTCVSDWLHDFDWTQGVNTCPEGKECVTFAKMYKNGKGLCEDMWDDAFRYVTDKDNCMVMVFDNTKENPNRFVDHVCLPGPFHKEVPSPEGDQFTECLSWKHESCCTVNVSLEIKHFKSVNLYDFYWDKCGPLSPECEMFIKDEECFYQCEPQLIFFEDPNEPGKGYIRDIPICADYCDSWFEACKNDKTCVVNWLDDFDWSQGVNDCPQGKECKTFAEMYGDGKGLCEKMWGDAFIYETNKDNCMVMAFDNSKENPNQHVVHSPSGGATIVSLIRGFRMTAICFLFVMYASFWVFS